MATGDERTHKLGNAFQGPNGSYRAFNLWKAGGAAVVAFKRGKSPITAKQA
jgi:hypothetical protein